MKKVKLLSTLALAAFLATASAGIVSADQTDSSIEFDNDNTTIVGPTDPENPGKPLPPTIDPTDPSYPNKPSTGPDGGLFLPFVPKTFNFGVQKVGASDIFSGKVLEYTQVTKYGNLQAVEVHDGRIDKDDWTVTAQLSEFDSKKLTGTTITIEDVTTKASYAGQEPIVVQGAKTEISQTAAVDFLKSNVKSKHDTSAVWKDEKVKIHVPAKEITKGAHNATVDWTLVAGAN
ncbi:MAG: WxL domain-containing protein [Lactococcus chungangensis]|jgi:hypothetical protein|uniref:WxL domain-containing protein n=1 Tax=Pseudolactococcus chungangensis TaxID=451457 RepID=A0A847J1Q3_9LACT|nr:WxL domain-containing protein [Lactococcus chungangensis]